VINDVFRMNCN